jgi:hypothetical protein
MSTSPTIVAATFRATGTIATYTNGVMVEQRLSDASVPATRGKLWIGGMPAGGIFTDGDIGEVIVYDDALSDIDRGRVEDYLSVKWSIAL